MDFPEITLKWEPRYPVVKDVVVVVAACEQGLSNVKLTASKPDGSVLPRGPVQVGKVGDLHTWTYELSPVQVRGVYELRFTADDVPDLVQTMLVQTGLPRAQYERTYVLLPPDADAEWAKVIVEETWNEKRFTVGSSADDAGIGDLDVRKIIAINAGHWSSAGDPQDPQDLIDFYKENYPGVELVCLTAETPEQLRGRFQADLAFTVAM